VTWTPVEPTWAAPPLAQVVDLHWLAYRKHQQDQGSEWASGVAATMAWVRHGRVAPVTERDEQPVTRALAVAEMWAATAAATPDIPPPPLAVICADLSVSYQPAADVHPEWADGAWRALRWLLGEQGQASPLPLPVRHADGSTPTENELYDLAMAASPLSFREPEQRAELRRRVKVNAARYRQLADLIEETKRSLAAA
jgi:hypothetical protein